jgi:hypothetical protein
MKPPPVEGAGFEPSVASSTGTPVRPVKLKKGVECKPDAEGEAWPTGRQQSQAMLFYGHAEPRIPGASNCGIISTVPPGIPLFCKRD